MFTGLIEDTGKITKMVNRADGRELTIACGIPVAEINLGDSIAVDGVCLTVTGTVSGGFRVDVSPESLERTTLGAKRTAEAVNLERALRLCDRLGGHLVSGHVDGPAAIGSIERKGDFIRIDFSASQNILKYIVEKGSVAIDGISLTVNQCTAKGFNVMIIPHTFSHTTLKNKKTGERVNIENDIVGKYIEKFVLSNQVQASGVTGELLQKYNFY